MSQANEKNRPASRIARRDEDTMRAGRNERDEERHEQERDALRDDERDEERGD